MGAARSIHCPGAARPSCKEEIREPAPRPQPLLVGVPMRVRADDNRRPLSGTALPVALQSCDRGRLRKMPTSCQQPNCAARRHVEPSPSLFLPRTPVCDAQPTVPVSFEQFHRPPRASECAVVRAAFARLDHRVVHYVSRFRYDDRHLPKAATGSASAPTRPIGPNAAYRAFRAHLACCGSDRTVSTLSLGQRWG